MPYQPGDLLLDKYRIVKTLGQGAFGEVYLVTHTQLNVLRVVKVLRRDAPGMDAPQYYGKAQARFLLEAQLGARLNTPRPNPRLLQIHDSHIDENLSFLEMEYAAGGSLAERIQKNRDGNRLMPLDEALRMALEVAEGLAALHALDIVHRDVKPANILFDEEGQAHLGDLGLAQEPGGPSQRSQLSSPEPHPGTPAYMSPEQKDSREYLASATDIYSLGATLFEALTGRLYSAQRPGTRAASLRVDLPAPLDDLLASMLSETPRARPWNGVEAAGLLRALLDAQIRPPRAAIVARKVARPPARREAERRPSGGSFGVGLWPMIGLGVLLLLLGGWFVFRPGAAPAATPISTLPRTPDANISMTAAVVRTAAAAAVKQTGIAAMYTGVARATQDAAVQTMDARVAQKTADAATATIAAMQTRLAATGTLTPTSALPGTPNAEAVYTAAAQTVAARFTENAATGSVTPPPAPGNASTWLRPADGMLMLYVPGGKFTMGSKDFSDTFPHQVTLSPYWIDQTDVTNSQYAKCVTAGGCAAPSSTASKTHSDYYVNSLYAKFPVMNLNWFQAKSYCEWSGQTSNVTVELPTEAQWELAARGLTGRTYPWGETIDLTYANYSGNVGDTTAVCSYPKGNSPYGACDMAGNVEQWVADWYGYSGGPVSNPSGPESGPGRVLRGGDWGSANEELRSVVRLNEDPYYANYVVGFRCARPK